MKTGCWFFLSAIFPKIVFFSLQHREIGIIGEWGLALTGTLIKIARPDKYESGVNLFFVLTYVVMGWMIIIAIVQVLKILPFMGFLWILIGGLCYSLGVLFFRLACFRHHHLVWHLFVIAGSISHFFAIFFYVIPLEV